MLVVRREVDERIIISGGIVITIVETASGYVKVGIDAPPHIDVDREEVWLSKQQSAMKPQPRS